MSDSSLLGISIGPVQGFIAAARRTRDLWFGSHLLSEIGKAASRELLALGGELIFPAPLSPAELEPDSPLNVGNKLLARVSRPDEAARRAVAEARRYWREVLAAEARQRAGEGVIREALWNRQIDDVLELYCAWVPLSDDYRADRARLERLLGARKSSRDFAQSATAFDQTPGFGVPKSSLDAARESVLQDRIGAARRRRLGIAQGEQLDCPGLVKRLGGNPEQFAPVTRVALETWLHRNPDADLAHFNALSEPLPALGLCTRVGSPRYGRLPFDGALLYPGRIEAALAALDAEESEAASVLARLEPERERLHRRHGHPTPYFAVLVADGDRMGAFIDAQHSIEAHQRFTAELSRFAATARTIVESGLHRGACVYSGGDDVLALLPLHSAVACARALKDAFVEHMARCGGHGAEAPSLSVGLGIGHVMTPFGELLSLGRKAEKLAKDGLPGTAPQGQRNALAILAGIRSGAEIAVRGQWHERLDERLDRWIRRFGDRTLSGKTPYDLRAGLADFDWARERGAAGLDLIVAETRRILGKKRGGDGHEIDTSIVDDIETALRAQQHWQPVVNELLIARWLSGMTES